MSVVTYCFLVTVEEIVEKQINVLVKKGILFGLLIANLVILGGETGWLKSHH